MQSRMGIWGSSWVLMALLGLALVAFSGCPADDDDDADDDTGDDDTADDDDDTGDDDTADDDDTMPEPECTYTNEWISVVGSEDAAGDASGYMVDIQEYEYQWDGTTLIFRITSHADFDDGDAGMMTDMYVGDGAVNYTLTYDNAQPNPGAMQIWTSADNWAAPLANPASYCHSDDEVNSIVMGIDLADLDASFVGLSELQGHAAANLWGKDGYVDSHPDSAENVVFPLEFLPNISMGAITWDDATNGNGDGIIDAGETGNVGIDLTNSGYADTGANVSATVSLNAGSTVAAAVNSDTSAYNGGAVLGVGATAGPDTSFVVQIDVGALEGQTLILDVAVTDDDGNAWNLQSAPRMIGALLGDSDDFASGFDIAGLYFTTDGTDLNLRVTSFDNHSGDQEVDIFLDIDMDGQADYSISTYDTTSGGYQGGGGIFLWQNGWTEVGQPTTTEFTSGTDYALFEVARAAVGGATQFQAWVQTFDPSFAEVDTMPDDTSDPADWAHGLIVNAPWIALDLATWTEGSGDGDDFIEAGEEWTVALSVINQGTADSAATAGVLSSSDADVTVTQANVDFGAIAVGNIGNGDVSATVTIDVGAPEIATYMLDLEVTADAEVYHLPIRVGLGVQPTDTTAGATEIPGPGVYFGDTTGFTDDYQNPTSCTGWTAAGADVVYTVDLAANQAFTAEIVYDTYPPDASIYLSTDATAPDTNCAAGMDDIYDASNETLDFTPTTAGLYYLVIDAYGAGEAGPYTLTLTY